MAETRFQCHVAFEDLKGLAGGERVGLLGWGLGADDQQALFLVVSEGPISDDIERRNPDERFIHGENWIEQSHFAVTDPTPSRFTKPFPSRTGVKTGVNSPSRWQRYSDFQNPYVHQAFSDFLATPP